MNYSQLIEKLSPRWRDTGFYGEEKVALNEFDLPDIIEVEPIHFCNLNCIMCHVHFEPAMSRTKLDLDLVAKQLSRPEFKDKWLMIASGYEGTAHPDFARFTNRLSDAGMKIEMTTNGSLLTDKLIDEIKDVNFRYVTLSFDGVTKSSYEFIREGGKFEQTVERISNFRRAMGRRETYFNVNYTTMRRNLDEVPAAVEFWDDLDFDQIFYIPMRVRPGGGVHAEESLENLLPKVTQRMTEAALDVIDNNRRITLASSFYLKSNLAESHPDNFSHHIVHSDNPAARVMINPRAYYQNGYYPDMHVDCRSPFKFARIDYIGDVFLCQRFKIGNIAEADFIDIWYGEQAKQVRQRVKAADGPCLNCDHYRLCVKADELDLEDPESLRQTVPELIGDFMDYSVIKVNGIYYGVPAATLLDNQPLDSKTTFQAATMEAVTDQITKHRRAT